jgi:hypothetical protein
MDASQGPSNTEFFRQQVGTKNNQQITMGDAVKRVNTTSTFGVYISKAYAMIGGPPYLSRAEAESVVKKALLQEKETFMTLQSNLLGDAFKVVNKQRSNPDISTDELKEFEQTTNKNALKEIGQKYSEANRFNDGKIAARNEESSYIRGTELINTNKLAKAVTIMNKNSKELEHLQDEATAFMRAMDDLKRSLF